EFGDPVGNILTNGKEILRDTLDAYLPAPWTRSLRYQSDNDEDRPTGLAELSAGHHVFSVVGHGDAFKFSSGNGVNPFIQTADTDTLTNGDRLMVYMGVACNPNEIDLESQGESLMNNPNGGTVIVLASTREDFPIASSAQQAEILRMAFDHGVTGFGAMSELGRVPYSGIAQNELTSERWTWLSKMLLGDPELKIWTQEPGNLSVAHAASVTLGTASVSVTVTDSLAVPLADALVCLSDGNGTYSRARTDGAGVAVLPLTSTATGTADLVVSLGDYRPYEGTVTINFPAGSHLAPTAQSVDDDGSGASSGNGDGVIDAGETVEYTVTTFNGGFATASSAALSASVEAGTSATFHLLYGGVADPARVFVGPDRVNPATVPFTLDFASPSIDYIGRPEFTIVPDSLLAGGPSGDEGIFVWQDREGWHVVWGGGVDSVAVTGFVATDGRIRKAGALEFENTDSFSLSAMSDTLTFSGTTHDTDGTDGLDLQLADSTMLTLTSSAAALGNIGTLGQADGTVVFDVANGARDGQVAYLDFTFTASAGGPWTDETTVVFAAPQLEAYVFSVEDGTTPPVSGNGNGVVEVGETVRITPTVINRGTGEATSVAGSATAASGITFLDAADSYGDIVSLTETAGTDGYVFTVNDGTGTSLDLTLTDSIGRTWMKNMDFVAPAASDSLWFTSSSTDITLSWTVSAAADVAGYNVYRSATSGSGHTKQNYELLRNGTVYVDEDLPFGSFFYYYVTAVDSSGNESLASPEQQAWTTQVQVPGWPSITQGFIYPSVLMTDADRDGQSEVFVGSHDFDFHGWNSDGAGRAGFPVATSFEIWGGAAAGDMDQDGDDELFFGSRDSRFYAVHDDGTALWNGNPVVADFPGAGEGVRSTATLADVDGDGRLEVLIGTDFGTLYAFNHDGSGMTDSTGLLFTAPPGNLTASIWGTVAVADLDNNGSKEIAFTSWNDSLYVIDATGTVLPGFPRAATDDYRGGVVAGDLDNDGTLEVLAGNFDGNLYAYNHDGTDYVPGAVLFSAVQKIAGGIALAQMDGDPELEIFFGSLNGKLYGLNHDGSSFLTGTGGVFADLPLGPTANDGISASPIVVDIDQDGSFEVFVGHRNKNFYGFHDDGSTVLGMPIPTDDINFSTAAAGDIDGDGDIDIAFASYDANVRVLDFSGAYSQAAVEWGTFGANNGRTATYGDLGPAVDAPAIAGGDTRWAFGIEQNAPNPFVGATTVRYTLSADRNVSLGVYNVTGRLVRTLVDGRMSAGRNAVAWDGRDAQGRRLASGIYFFRLNDGERTVTRKSVLLR
ncbi:MAG: T9SS type A sorting domain-containing protein, partial [Gemmatimonadetes bacterium]|nr:T9SS type A sorting domain-containing protein [Gemmatimonadota bacterium]